MTPRSCLELKRLLVQIDRDRVSLTIHQKRGTQASRVIVGEDSTLDNVHPLDAEGVGRSGRIALSPVGAQSGDESP